MGNLMSLFTTTSVQKRPSWTAIQYSLLLCSFVSFTACTTTTHYGNTQVRTLPAPKTYIVQPGDTLGKIGQRYGLNYLSIAQINNIPAPYNTIYVGQPLNLKGAVPLNQPIQQPVMAKTAPERQVTSTPKTTHVTHPVATTTAPPVAKPSAPVTNETIHAAYQTMVNNYTQTHWQKPVTKPSQLLFNAQTKTVYYVGRLGDPVYAVAAGQVVYAGETLSKGNLEKYGNLVMIQHSDDYVSIYAHNQKIYVSNGQTVAAGQHIGSLGTSGNTINQPNLGFQLRKSAQNIDPMSILPH